MRRIASVFKRNDKNKHDTPPQSAAAADPAATPARSQTLRSQPSKKGRFLASISTDPLPVPLPDQNNSSASSSASATCSLQTPDDERGSQIGLHTPSRMSRKGWFPWQYKVPPQVVPTLSYLPSSPSPRLHAPSPPLHWPELDRTPAPVPPHIARDAQDSVDSDEDTSDSSSSSSSAPLRPLSQFLGSDRLLAPTEFLTQLTVNKMTPRMSQPPLLDSYDAPLFPRSTNLARSLHADSLSIRMHRARTLARLQRHDLSPTDEQMILAVGSRPTFQAEVMGRAQLDEGARYDLKRVLPHSRGLRRWIARPYFEERFSIWAPETASGTVCQFAVKGSSYGVLALEVSEALELLAGSQDLGDTQPVSAPTSAARDTGFVSDRDINLPSAERLVPPRAPSSPLRHQSNTSSAVISTSLPAASPSSVTLSSRSQQSMPSATSTSTVSTIMPVAVSSEHVAPKREVRFTATSTKEDKIPKDYVLRIQKNREEKARFLREEQARREHEAERLRHEQERQQWEEEKRQWEREKRLHEEEARKKAYADELVAARARRGAQHVLPAHASRDSRESYARPVYDRRQGSESSVGVGRTREGSSGSSRQGSSYSSGIGSAPRTPNDSRPPSTFSTRSVSSTDDARASQPRASRRGSTISDAASLRSTNSMMAYGWSPVPPVPAMSPVGPMMPGYVVPVMPMLPQFAAMPVDMPLLPPNAPFMMHGNGSRSRTSSRTSSPRNASPARSLGTHGSNQSSERVGAGTAANRGRTHQRSGSGDSKRALQLSQPSVHDRASSSSRAKSGQTSGHAARPTTLTVQNSWAAPMPHFPPHPAPVRRSTAFA